MPQKKKYLEDTPVLKMLQEIKEYWMLDEFSLGIIGRLFE